MTSRPTGAKLNAPAADRTATISRARLFLDGLGEPYARCEKDLGEDEKLSKPSQIHAGLQPVGDTQGAKYMKGIAK